MNNNELSTLRGELERYRNLLRLQTDAGAKAAISEIIREIETRLRALDPDFDP